MESLKEVIVAHRTKRDYTAENIQKLEEEWTLYNETGFELKARELRHRLLFAKAAQKLGNPILIKRPDFHRERYHVHPFPKLYLRDAPESRYRGDAVYLYEVEPSIFKGEVPTAILKTTLAAKNLGFKPYVWFVSRQTEVDKHLHSPLLRADPAIVAYPIVGNDSGQDLINNELGVVLGLWGKDIEEISKAFEPTSK